ncbi:MAG: hypothetical protein K2X25_10120 [Caulobacteraceae bacterium]|nr:hypothetical protein [Caulobacteraceae bacterium]
MSETERYALDASVCINLAATGRATEIFEALKAEFFVTRVVVEELARGRGQGRSAADELATWLHLGFVMEQDLLPESEDTFLSLVGGPAAVTIDDGEAATIAWAITNDAVIVTDDRKAVQIAKVRFPLLKVLSTTDLLLHGNCQNALGPSAVVDCIENALLNAFMRVPIDQLDRVVQLLGPERTKKCRSLPSAVRG